MAGIDESRGRADFTLRCGPEDGFMFVLSFCPCLEFAPRMERPRGGAAVMRCKSSSLANALYHGAEITFGLYKSNPTFREVAPRAGSAEVFQPDGEF
jgi:hypothetical protein